MRSPGLAAPLGACVALVAACGGIPSSGSPMPAAPASDDDSQPHVVGTRPGPEEGATPVEIVEGFIAAMEFYESPPRGYPTAAEFLTQAAASDWDPLSEIVIYDDNPAVEIQDDVATLTVDVAATYDRTNGFVRPPESADPVTYEFDLEQVAGEWRLADAPDGLLIQETAFDNDFEAYNLYFYNKSFDRTTLVPDPVYLPRTANNLETLLVQELLDGPSEWLAPAVGTAFPEGTTLEPAAVTVDDGAARVTLNEAALQYEDGTPTSPEERQLMVEQLVRTLGEQRTVDRVSVAAPRATLLSGTDESPYVDVPETSSPVLVDRLYTISESGVGELRDTSSAEVAPVAGPLGAQPGLQEVAVARNHQTAAAVNENGNLVLAELNADSELTELFPAGGAFGSLAWDGSGLLWAIERDRAPEGPDADGDPAGESGGTDAGEQAGDEQAGGGERAQGDSGNRLLVIDPDTGDVHPVTPPTPGDAEIEKVAMAPDGTRLAYVADGRVFEAIVVRNPDRPVDPKTVEVRAPRELHFEGITEPVADVTWHGAGELAVLTAPTSSGDESLEPGSADDADAADPRAHVVSLNELNVERTREVGNGVSIAAPIEGNLLAVGTSENVVWIRSSTVRWVTLEDASAPAFAG